MTGATSGLGRAAAIHLAEQGYRVFAAGRSGERRAALQATARERQLALTTLEMDVRDDGSVDRAMAQIEAAGASVDVLINNAGVAYVVPVEEIRIADLREQFEIECFWRRARDAARSAHDARARPGPHHQHEFARRPAGVSAVRRLFGQQIRARGNDGRAAPGGLPVRD